MKSSVIAMFAVLLVLGVVLTWLAQGPQVLYAGEDSQSLQRCDAILGPQAVRFSQAREQFARLGFRIRRATLVREAEDLKGSIMSLFRREWVYVTHAELRYDPDQMLLVFSRLEGYLLNGQPIRLDRTSVLPFSFRLVTDWNEIGPAFVKDVDGEFRRMDFFGLTVDDQGRVVRSDPQGSSSFEIQSAGGVCRPGGGVDCIDFCIGTCRVGPGAGGAPDCSCPNFPFGFCLIAPGLHCGGICPDPTARCRSAFTNPGSVACACVSEIDLPLPE